MPEATSSSAESATASARMRKMLSRISGASLRRSMATKASSSATGTAPRPSVRAEPQP